MVALDTFLIQYHLTILTSSVVRNLHEHLADSFYILSPRVSDVATIDGCLIRSSTAVSCTTARPLNQNSSSRGIGELIMVNT